MSSREERFQRARESAQAKLENHVSLRDEIIALFVNTTGKTPDISTGAEHEALGALVKHFSEGGAIDQLDQRALSKVKGAMRSGSLFDTARSLVTGFPEPLGADRHVWRTPSGQMYHRYIDCEALRAGKQKAGWNPTTGVSRVRLSHARVTRGFDGALLRPCKACRP